MAQEFAAQEDKIFKEEVEQVKQWFKVGADVLAVPLPCAPSLEGAACSGMTSTPEHRAGRLRRRRGHPRGGPEHFSVKYEQEHGRSND